MNWGRIFEVLLRTSKSPFYLAPERGNRSTKMYWCTRISFPSSPLRMCFTWKNLCVPEDMAFRCDKAAMLIESITGTSVLAVLTLSLSVCEWKTYRSKSDDNQQKCKSESHVFSFCLLQFLLCSPDTNTNSAWSCSFLSLYKLIWKQLPMVKVCHGGQALL
jgi:hypothetical protein